MVQIYEFHIFITSFYYPHKEIRRVANSGILQVLKVDLKTFFLRNAPIEHSLPLDVKPDQNWLAVTCNSYAALFLATCPIILLPNSVVYVLLIDTQMIACIALVSFSWC